MEVLISRALTAGNGGDSAREAARALKARLAG
jgi:hypothetical protein